MSTIIGEGFHDGEEDDRQAYKATAAAAVAEMQSDITAVLDSLLALAIACASVHFGLKFVYKTLRKTIIAVGEQLSTCRDQLEEYKKYDITPSVKDVKKAMLNSFIEGIHERSTKR
ncbi:MAG TPA: hypothetical protein VFY50_00710 [Candidatus Nitrosocosmicus sp.]|nr:hypothetical protein [Candidatus Nitrosocosmicus sp.]